MEGGKTIDHWPTAKETENMSDFLMSKMLVISVDLTPAANAACRIPDRFLNA